MKKVIFVCLLTLSVCLSDDPGNASKAGNEMTPAAKPPAANASAANTIAANTPASSVPATDDNNKTKNQDPATKPPVPGTQNNIVDTPAPEKNDTNTNATTTSSTKPDNTTTITVGPTEHITPNTTAVPPSTEKASSPKPAATTVLPHTLQARGFDGASFVGGIILTLGLLAIGFMGFKYYKAQTERNYHTL